MISFRSLALPILTALSLAYAGLLWWAGQTIESYENASGQRVSKASQTTGSGQRLENPPQVIAQPHPGIDRGIGKAELQIATWLLVLATLALAAFSVWKRPREVAATLTQESPASRARTEELLAKIDQQQQQLDAMQAALTDLRGQTGEAQNTDGAPADHSSSGDGAQLLANLSHELRTPLHGILGNTQQLRRNSQTDPSSIPTLETIESCGQQLLRFVNDLIDLGRLEAGKLTLHNQPCQLQQVVDGASKVLQQHAEEKGVTLQIDSTPTPLPWVISDGLRLRQLITRLTISAFDRPAIAHGDRVPIKLHLRLAADSFTISIKGQARKQPQPGQPHTEQSLDQIEIDDLSHTVGSRLVSLFGGEILSDVATGDLSARIPCELAAEQDATIEPVAVEPIGSQVGFTPAAVEQQPGKAHCRLMIVDTEAPERARVANLLTNLDCTVAEEPSIERASRRLQDQVYDLVLLATGEPGPMAEDRASELRMVAAGEPKVIAFSNTPNPRGLEKIGFDAVLTKPIRQSQLVTILGDLLETPLLDVPGVAEQDQPAAPLPQTFFGAMAAQIVAALDRGDIDDLLAIADDLGERRDIDPRVSEQVTNLARRFDFVALRQVAERLAASSTDIRPDA